MDIIDAIFQGKLVDFLKNNPKVDVNRLYEIEFYFRKYRKKYLYLPTGKLVLELCLATISFFNGLIDPDYYKTPVSVSISFLLLRDALTYVNLIMSRCLKLNESVEWSPLHFAVALGDLGSVNLLLCHGAKNLRANKTRDRNLLYNVAEGESPTELAERLRKPEIARIIEQYSKICKVNADSRDKISMLLGSLSKKKEKLTSKKELVKEKEKEKEDLVKEKEKEKKDLVKDKEVLESKKNEEIKQLEFRQLEISKDLSMLCDQHKELKDKYAKLEEVCDSFYDKEVTLRAKIVALKMNINELLKEKKALVRKIVKLEGKDVDIEPAKKESSSLSCSM